MRVPRFRTVIGFVVLMGLVQLFYEDILVFLGATTAGQGTSLPRFVLIAVPLTITISLLAVLLWWAMFETRTFR